MGQNGSKDAAAVPVWRLLAAVKEQGETTQDRVLLPRMEWMHKAFKVP